MNNNIKSNLDQSAIIFGFGSGLGRSDRCRSGLFIKRYGIIVRGGRERGIGIERKGERGKPRKSIDSHNKIENPIRKASNVMRETIEVSIKK